MQCTTFLHDLRYNFYSPSSNPGMLAQAVPRKGPHIKRSLAAFVEAWAPIEQARKLGRGREVWMKTVRDVP